MSGPVGAVDLLNPVDACLSFGFLRKIFWCAFLEMPIQRGHMVLLAVFVAVHHRCYVIFPISKCSRRVLPLATLVFFCAVWSFLLLGRLKTSQADR